MAAETNNKKKKRPRYRRGQKATRHTTRRISKLHDGKKKLSHMRKRKSLLYLCGREERENLF